MNGNGAPLLNAASNSHTEAVVALLSAGADPNAQDDEGRTPCTC